MEPNAVLRAACARAMFTCHGVLVVFSLSAVFGDRWPFYLLSIVALMVLETSLSLILRKGREWGIFCPSVFLYLAMVLPGLWVVEMSALSERMMFKNCTNLSSSDVADMIGPNAHIVTVFGFQLNAAITMENSTYNRALRQFLPLFIIVARCLMPKVEMTHDQLSQLLMIYLGTAADITDFYDSLQFPVVRCSKELTTLVLALWTCSLLQFAVLIRPNQTTTNQIGLLKGYLGDDLRENFSRELVWAVTTIFLQYNQLSPTNVFYLFKNTLTIIILVYRVTVVKVEWRRRERQRVKELVLARAVLCRMRRATKAPVVWDTDMRRKSVKDLCNMMPSVQEEEKEGG